MKTALENIQKKALEDIQKCEDIKTLEEVRILYLGKKGELTQILRGMGGLSKEERPVIGQVANEVRGEIEAGIQAQKEIFEKKGLKEKLAKEEIDVSLPAKMPKVGHAHPLMKVIGELEEIFMRMGYDVVEGPEIEWTKHNFDDLNIPESHPSRDASDTFYIQDNMVLRTHTSPVQVRVMRQMKPPIRVVAAGRTFRFDEVDDTHSPMFHQLECLVVDKGINMSHLKDAIDTFVKELFGEGIETRFRPHHFDFTEPSAEVDVSCHLCKGAGCESCHHTGWSMELLGCGMVHPNVLRSCGIDPEIYSGFAFGMGLDRVTMVKYGIKDIRQIFDNDMRFIEQL